VADSVCLHSPSCNSSHHFSASVDKIIIDQDSLREFINVARPGAYASLTKVNFKSLDQLVVQPIGVYGCKEEIVKFFVSVKAVDEQTYAEHFIQLFFHNLISNF
jgi:hypothetical protein